MGLFFLVIHNINNDGLKKYFSTYRIRFFINCIVNNIIFINTHWRCFSTEGKTFLTRSGGNKVSFVGLTWCISYREVNVY